MVDMKAMNRRELLRNSVTVSGLMATGSGVVKAASSSAMLGVTYDTLTHKMGNEIKANVSIGNSGKVQGSATIAGFPLELGEIEGIDEGGPGTRYQGELSSEKHIKSGYSNGGVSRDLPLLVDLRVMDNHISGVLKRPHADFGKLGFVLAEDGNPAMLKEHLTPDSKWIDSPHQFEIPDRGIPTDTGIRRLGELSGTPHSPKEEHNE